MHSVSRRVSQAVHLGAVVLTTLLAASGAIAQKAVKPPIKSVIAIRNARILPVSSPEIPVGTVLIVNGKIRAVGASVTIPAGATIIEGVGKVVIPGLVDAGARFGLGETANEQASEVTPSIHVLEQVNRHSPELRRALQSGVTTACFTPGPENIVGGLCGAAKTYVSNGEFLPLRDNTAILAALGEDTFNGNGSFLRANAGNLSSIYLRRPNSRMGAVFELRHALDSLKLYPELKLVRMGALPLRIHATAANDIRAAVTIADEFKVPHIVIDDCIEGYRDLDILAARHIPVVLGPLFDPQLVSPERAATVLNNAGLLSDAGVPVAFGSHGGDETQLREYAIYAVRAGMKPDLALRALTLTAAEIGGVADRVGSLQDGKDADLLILSGDPLDLTSHIERVIVNGQVVYRAE